MIKAIIFDVGNVIVKFDNHKFIKKISEHSKKSPSELYDLIYKSDLVKKYEFGKISSDEFYKNASLVGSLNISKEEFRKAYTEVFTPIETMLDLIKKLKQNYKLALLSNISEWDYEIGIKPIIKDLFEIVSLSYEIKSRKPEKEIYLDVLEKLNLEAKECIFVDDLEKNIEAAKKLGINAILYKNYKSLTKNFDDLRIEYSKS